MGVRSKAWLSARIRSGRVIGVSRGDGTIVDKMKSGRQRGFTLIEILLATTVLAAGLALGFATLRAATATANRAEAMAERSERILSATTAVTTAATRQAMAAR
jgi:prepilin-type N-terminal cleavage/methylation domain-containing protein